MPNISERVCSASVAVQTIFQARVPYNYQPVTLEAFREALITDHFSGPASAIGSACVSMRTMTFELDDLWPRYLASWFILTLSRSTSNVKVMGQSSMAQEENVAKMVSATSSEGFAKGLSSSDFALTSNTEISTSNVQVHATWDRQIGYYYYYYQSMMCVKKPACR